MVDTAATAATAITVAAVGGIRTDALEFVLKQAVKIYIYIFLLK